MIKKTDKGGFRNPKYDRIDRIFGFLALILLIIVFIGIVILMFKTPSPIL